MGEQDSHEPRPRPRLLNKRTDRIPAGAVDIGRQTKWDNPFLVGRDGTHREVMEKYRRYLLSRPELVRAARRELVGRNLVTWHSPLPGHGTVLLEIANGPANTPTGHPWAYSDAGRAASRRPRQGNDCTVRALAIARGLSYDEAYDLLAHAGRRSGQRLNLGPWLSEQAWARKIAFPAVKGQPRMTPPSFCTRFAQGRFICKAAKHVFAVVDGVVYDTEPVGDRRCIYTAWRIEALRPHTMEQ